MWFYVMFLSIHILFDPINLFKLDYIAQSASFGKTKTSPRLFKVV